MKKISKNFNIKNSVISLLQNNKDNYTQKNIANTNNFNFLHFFSIGNKNKLERNTFKTNFNKCRNINLILNEKKFFLNNLLKRQSNLNFFKYSIKNFSSSKHVDKDGFPIPEKRDIYDEDDMIINIGEKEKFKGMLIICPTPLGNINDISIRQFEAMKNGDILACEDSRKTGKLLEFIQLKKMKEKFYAEFGIGFEEFVNMGGLNMTDEQIYQQIFKKEYKNEDLHNYKNQTENGDNKKDDSVYYDEVDIDLKPNKERFDNKMNEQNNLLNKHNNDYQSENFNENTINFDNFYKTKDDVKKNKTLKSKYETSYKEEEIKLKENIKRLKEIMKDNPDKEVITDILKKKSLNKNQINSLDNIFTSIDLNLKGKSHLDKEEFLSTIKLEEPIDKEYYSFVKDEKDFHKKKFAIKNSDELLKKAIDPIAENYEKEDKLSYKLRNKARFLMGMSKKYEKKNSENIDNEKMNEEERREYEENLEEEITLNTGIEDDMLGAFKLRIKEEKEKKGRGLLIPFNQENEDKKIPKLIKAMKLGLRVVLLSDSGTPTISDPGYKLVKEASKNGIVIEPLPGPSAVLTALSSSALPTDKFMFYGFLPKNANEKFEKLEEIKTIGVTSVFFESPMRLQSTINLLTEIYGEEHEIYIGFELTKKFENHFHGCIKNVKKDLIKHFLDKNRISKMNFIDEQKIFKEEDINFKGEITLVLGAIKKSREEHLEEKNLKEKIDIDIIEFTKRLNKYMDLKESEIRDILIKVCEIPRVKATKVINNVKNRKTQIRETFEMMTNKNIESMKIPEMKNIKKGMLEEKTSKNVSIKNFNSISFK